MKTKFKILLGIGFVVSLLLFSSAQARSVVEAVGAKITDMDIDPDDSSLQRLAGGFIYIDNSNSEIILTLYRKFYCPPRRLCAQVMPAPIIIKVPLLSIDVEPCGSVKYSGRVNYLAVDGAIESLKVVDYSNNKCMYLPVDQKTLIEYQRGYFDRVKGEFVSFKSRFKAEELKPR